MDRVGVKIKTGFASLLNNIAIFMPHCCWNSTSASYSDKVDLSDIRQNVSWWFPTGKNFEKQVADRQKELHHKDGPFSFEFVKGIPSG